MDDQKCERVTAFLASLVPKPKTVFRAVKAANTQPDLLISWQDIRFFCQNGSYLGATFGVPVRMGAMERAGHILKIFILNFFGMFFVKIALSPFSSLFVKEKRGKLAAWFVS
ncbi:MAG: hypothetical protein KF852_09575 [Saprospiraceae bacterium]|nr:hypothetical protein [Saprospiraceae bacterium]